jgi:hypothetical protein
MTRRVLALLVLVAAVGLVLSTGGVSSVEADRALTVSVADSDEAYVSLAACRRPASDGSETATAVEVELTNRLSDPLDGATVRGLDGTQTVQRRSEARAFDDLVGPGETRRRTLTFESTVTHLRVVTRTVDGGVAADVRVTVDPRSDPDCPLAGSASEA